MLRIFAITCASLFVFWSTPSEAQIVQKRMAPGATVSTGTLVNHPVLVVDPSGNGDHFDIISAIQAAPDRCLLLIRPGQYMQAPVIAGRSIKLVADGTGPVEITGPMSVSDIAADASVSLVGLTLLEGVNIEDCAGPVQVQDCHTPPGSEPVGPPPGTSYPDWSDCGIGESKHNVLRSDAVSFVNCTFYGAEGLMWGPWDGTPGHHGMLVEDSAVALYGCTLVGGEGHSSTSAPPFNVGGGAGGDALRLKGANAWVRHCDVQYFGGMGGFYFPTGPGSLTYACDGVPINADAGSVDQPCTHPTFQYSVPNVLRTGDIGWHNVVGTPGSLVSVQRSRDLAWTPYLPSEGIGHLAQQSVNANVGFVTPAGTLHRPFPVGGPYAPTGHVAVQMQASTSVAGITHWSAPRLLVVLDRSIP